MGIGGPATSLLSILHNNNLLNNTKSVVEIGAQDINLNCQSLVNSFPHPVPSRLEMTSKIKFSNPKEMYQSIGINIYESIDVNGHAGSKPYDLNKNLEESYDYKEKFDLVTNFGSTEHIFNQYENFKNMHNLCKENGLMIGIVPMQGALDHGFFNYQPILFEHLAISNNYKMNLFWTIATQKFYAYNLLPYEEKFISRFKSYVKFNVIDYKPHGYEEQIGYVLQKTNSETFNVPDQSYIGKGGTRIELKQTIPKVFKSKSSNEINFEDYLSLYGHKGIIINILRFFILIKKRKFRLILNLIFKKLLFFKQK